MIWRWRPGRRGGGRFRGGQFPPPEVAIHLPEAFSKPGVQRVSGVFDTFDFSEGDDPAVHGKTHGERSFVVHQRSEGAGIAMVRQRQDAVRVR